MYQGFFLLLLIGFLPVSPSMRADETLEYLNRILGSAEAEAEKSIGRLSTGHYLLPDDPANQAIYELLEAHIRGLDRKIANERDMLSYYQVGDAYLDQVTAVLQRVRELLVKRANSLYLEDDRELLDLEVNRLYEHVLFILRQAKFNKKKMFSPILEQEYVRNWFQREAYYRLDRIDGLIGFFLRQRAMYGAMTRTLESRLRGRELARENMMDFQSSIGDVSFGLELERLRRSHLLTLINLLLLDLVG
jgi:flagellin